MQWFSSYKWLLIKEGTEKPEGASTCLAIGIGSQVNYHVIAMEKVAEQQSFNNMF